MNRTMTDQEINQYAVFYPHHEAADDSDTTRYPCIELGGDEDGNGAIQIYAYVRDGILVVSVDYDTAGPTGDDSSGPWAYYGPDNAVPTVINAGAADPVWEAFPEDACTEADARQIRKAYADQPDMWPSFVLPDWAVNPFGPDAYKTHQPGCTCPDCRAARDETAGPDTLRELRDNS